MMMTQLVFLGLTLWLAGYMVVRDVQTMPLRLTAMGMGVYAIVLVNGFIWVSQRTELLAISALCWIGAMVYMLPESVSWRALVVRIWLGAVVPLFILVIINPWVALVILGGMVVCLVAVMRHMGHIASRAWYRFMTVSGLFFALSTSMVLVPLQIVAHDWLMLVLGVDLLLLGSAVLWWDVFNAGDLIRTHAMRSLVATVVSVGSLIAIVWLAASVDGGLSAGYRMALVGVTTLGVVSQVFANAMQRILDRLTMAHQVTMNQQREVLRDTADALPRLATVDVLALDDDAFVRVTRRAISHLGDLPKLATSPLMNLPAVVHAPTDNPLDRVMVLRTLLVESIERLKPVRGSEFGTTDEWRYYNALYFPYVRGIKPYGRRYGNDVGDEASRQAFAWFQSAVPERTLRNWQQAAAKLVAHDLRSSR
ncbi:MAG: hypothetical protein RI985_2035 [Chloroflexota bacterium]|jgi:hypothetical protein